MIRIIIRNAFQSCRCVLACLGSWHLGLPLPGLVFPRGLLQLRLSCVYCLRCPTLSLGMGMGMRRGGGWVGMKWRLLRNCAHPHLNLNIPSCFLLLCKGCPFGEQIRRRDLPVRAQWIKGILFAKPADLHSVLR